MKKRRIGWWLLDAVWLIALAVYVLAGRDNVPFHGDESTLIAMSADYFTLVHQHDLDPILYDPTPADGIAQHLRLVNGPVAKMAMGLAEDLDGWTIHDLNSPWVWEWSWDQNVALGHMPNWYLLRAARTSSALLLIASIGFLFGIARAVSGNRIAAYAATLIYTTTPAVLMNIPSPLPLSTTFVSPVTMRVPAARAARPIERATRHRVSISRPSSRMNPALSASGRAPHIARSFTVPFTASEPMSPPGKINGRTTYESVVNASRPSPPGISKTAPSCDSLARASLAAAPVPARACPAASFSDSPAANAAKNPFSIS